MPIYRVLYFPADTNAWEFRLGVRSQLNTIVKNEAFRRAIQYYNTRVRKTFQSRR